MVRRPRICSGLVLRALVASSVRGERGTLATRSATSECRRSFMARAPTLSEFLDEAPEAPPLGERTERYIHLQSLRARGLTLREIGVRYALTRERVRYADLRRGERPAGQALTEPPPTLCLGVPQRPREGFHPLRRVEHSGQMRRTGARADLPVRPASTRIDRRPREASALRGKERVRCPRRRPKRTPARSL